MLDGNYLWDIPDSVVDLWEELEDWAIEDIIERILMTDKKNQTKTGATASYRFDLLNRLGMDMNNVYIQLSEYTKKSEKELKDIFIDAGAKCLENDNMVYLQHGIKDALTGSNQWVRQLMESMYQKTCGEMKNFTGTFARGYQKTVLELMDRAYVETITGMKSHAEAVADVIDDLGRIGITSVEYDKGHRDMVETAVRRAVLTGVNRTAIQISLENAKRLGTDYVVISSHLGARVAEDKIANHAGWQGKIYKIEGSDKTAPNLREETGYPDNPLGFGGYNCRHNIFPYFPGDPNPFEQFNKTENEKAYRLSQQQRAKERAIRKSKRQLLALGKGMEAAPDEATKAALQERYDKASFLYAKRNKAYNQFCEDNDLKSKAERLRIAKWNRSQAGMANAGARRYILEKQAGTVSSGGKNNTINVITKESINNVQKIYADGMSEQEAAQLQVYHKQLLSVSQKKNASKEVAVLLDKDMNQITTVFGNETEIDLNVGGRTAARYVLHNHPNNSSFSNRDLLWLLKNDNVKYFSIVKNNGEVEILYKPDNFDISLFKVEYLRLQKRFGKDIERDEQKGYNKLVDTLLKKTKSGLILTR